MSETIDTTTNEIEQGKLFVDLSDDVRELAIARLLGEKPLIEGRLD